jgi:hypothetical protein
MHRASIGPAGQTPAAPQPDYIGQDLDEVAGRLVEKYAEATAW